MRTVVIIHIAAACALLAGCGNGRLLYSFEPPFWSTMGDPRPLRVSLTFMALRAGYVPQFDITPSADPVATLAGSLAGGLYSAVVVGPLLSFQWAEYAARFPRTRFVLIDASPPAAGVPPNAVFLMFDRTEAFRAAGRLAGSAAAGASVSLVGILSCEGAGLLPAESNAFARGVVETEPEELPLAQTLPASPDPSTIRAAVTQMRSQGASVFLLGLGDRDPDGLDAVRDVGGRAVVSDWGTSEALPSLIVAAVEEDVTAGLRAALRALRAGTPRVQGPVRVRSGKKI